MRIVLPESIQDITLHQFQLYNELLERTDLDEYNFNKRKIQIFTGLERTRIDLIGSQDYKEITEQIDLALNQTVEFKPTFFIKDVEFGFIPNLDKITQGEFIDISKYGTDINEMHRLMAVLFRPIKNKDAVGNYEIINYKGTEQYANIMKHTPLSIVNGVLVFFFEFSQRISELYPELRGGTNEGSSAADYFEKWGWYATIEELAKGKIWKIDGILKMNVHEVHLFLCHKIDKQKLKAKIMKQTSNTIEL